MVRIVMYRNGLITVVYLIFVYLQREEEGKVIITLFFVGYRDRRNRFFYFHKSAFPFFPLNLIYSPNSNLMFMEAILNNEQVRPGDETMFMHAVFTSEEEMRNFYLILNRFVNPTTYFIQRADTERLENLRDTLGKFERFINIFGTYKIPDRYNERH